MAIHAQLNEEAQARFRRQQRNSTISSIVIALLTLLLIGLILGFIFLEPLLKETPVIIGYTASSQVDDDQLDVKKVTNTLDRRPSAPAASMNRVIVANAAAPTAIPVPDVNVAIPTMDFGDGDDFGDSWASGETGDTFGNIPATMSKRCSLEDRMERLLSNGGTKECEDAVVKGLDWLQKTQNSDGSWTSGAKQAMTGLALLAYLGHCETPLSERYSDTVLKGITYLISVGMKMNGRLTTSAAPGPQVYEHAIACYALAEATTFCKQLGINIPNLEEVTQKAAQYIIDKQHKKTGGWDYGFATESKRGGDLSVAVWQIQALKAAMHTGLKFKGMEICIRRGLAYAESCQANSGGFAYRPGGGEPAWGYYTLTGAGMLSFQMAGNPSSSPVRKGEKYVTEKAKFEYDTPDSDLYGHYYAAQAMIARGGKAWQQYNNMFRDELLKSQNPDGSWKAPNKGSSQGYHATAGGTVFSKDGHYRTALCVLMLETYYRFLPGTGEALR